MGGAFREVVCRHLVCCWVGGTCWAACRALCAAPAVLWTEHGDGVDPQDTLQTLLYRDVLHFRQLHVPLGHAGCSSATHHTGGLHAVWC
jgi:hypothetical protein